MKYTKKQIFEAIAYWKRQLRRLNESEGGRCECEATLKVTYDGANGYSAADAMFDALCRKFGGGQGLANDSGSGRLEIAVEGGSSSDEAEKGYDFITQLNALIQNGHI